MEHPPVTVVVPLHNHADWIGQALASLEEQDYPNLRIVVVDDGSTDNGIDEVCKVLARSVQPDKQGEPWVCKGKFHGIDLMLFRFEEAHGPSFARNWGIKAAWDCTDIFAFLDSDDLYHPQKVSKSVKEFQRSPLVGAVYSDFDTLRPDGLRLRQWKQPYSRSLLLRDCIVNCDSLVTKAVLEKSGLFDESLRCCEDYDLWLRVSEHCLISHLAESLVTVRVGPHSSSATVPSETWKACYARVFEKVAERSRS